MRSELKAVGRLGLLLPSAGLTLATVAVTVLVLVRGGAPPPLAPHAATAHHLAVREAGAGSGAVPSVMPTAAPAAPAPGGPAATHSAVATAPTHDAAPDRTPGPSSLAAAAPFDPRELRCPACVCVCGGDPTARIPSGGTFTAGVR